MDYVHFLNIEYLLLRAYDFFNSQTVVTGTYDTFTEPASQTLHPITFTLGLVAILGMIITVILFIVVVIVRIRLEVVEHEGFHAMEHEHEVHSAVLHTEETPPANARWEHVFELANGPSESDWRLAILEADIMLDDLLKQQGYRGETMGERLRDANPLQFSTLDLAWKAHKVRNDIAHAGSEYHLSQRDANATIDLYRRVFEEFNFI